MEVWKDIEGFIGYQVSSYGQVRSTERYLPCADGVVRKFKGKLLRQNRNNSGYLQVMLTNPGKRYNSFVHRLVAEAFLGGVPRCHDVCHCDGDKDNNRADNLRIDTRKGNMADCIIHGTRAYGERNAASRLKEHEVLAMRHAFFCEKVTVRHIAQEYGISRGHVSDILAGRRWNHVGGPLA